MKFCNRRVTKKKLMEFQNWYKANYEYATQCNYHSNIKNLLEWLFKKTGNPEFREMKEILEPPRKSSKKINPILIREPDIHNLIKAVWNTDTTLQFKLKHIAGILFAAYTGQRPQATIGKLTLEEFREAIQRSAPSCGFQRRRIRRGSPTGSPLHPVVVDWVKVTSTITILNWRGRKQKAWLSATTACESLFDRLKLPRVSGEQVIKALVKAGWSFLELL